MEEKMKGPDKTPAEKLPPDKVDAERRDFIVHIPSAVAGAVAGITAGTAMNAGKELAKIIQKNSEKGTDLTSEQLSSIISSFPDGSPELRNRFRNVSTELARIYKRLESLSLDADDERRPENERILINAQIQLELEPARRLQAFAELLMVHIEKKPGAPPPDERGLFRA